MSTYYATIEWQRNTTEAFIDNAYHRGHQWQFDGGSVIVASSSPLVVPLPYSDETAVDPEEAFVASVSSCHMLWFLSLAAKQGMVIDSYRDTARGVMKKDSQGQLSITDVYLSPAITCMGQKTAEDTLATLHEQAHQQCFIARSIKSKIHILLNT